MTEKTLFQATLMTLGATILGPLFVATTNIAGTVETASEKLRNYVASAQETTADKDDEKSDKADKDADKTKTTDKDADADKTAPVAGMASAKKASTYTVKDGDTYGCIAEKYYGSYDQWTRVYDVNAGWLGFNEYDLAVGAKVQLPAVSAAEVLPKTNLCQ